MCFWMLHTRAEPGSRDNNHPQKKKKKKILYFYSFLSNSIHENKTYFFVALYSSLVVFWYILWSNNRSLIYSESDICSQWYLSFGSCMYYQQSFSCNNICGIESSGIKIHIYSTHPKINILSCPIVGFGRGQVASV